MHDPFLLNALLVVTAVIAVWAPFRWKQSTKAQQFLIIYVIEIFIIEFVEVLLTYFHRHNLWLIIFYYLKINEREKSFLLFTGVSFIIFWLISKFTFEPLSTFNSYTSVVARLFQISISVSVFFDILKDPNVRLKNDPRIWIASGIMIYSTGSLILCILFLEIAKLPLEVFKTIWQINLFLNIVSEFLYARGIWCRVTH